MQTLANKNGQGSKTKKELEAISEKIKNTRVKIEDIIVPLSAGIVLLLLGIFVFVPMIRATVSFRQEFNTLKEKEKQLDVLENTIKSMDDAQLQVDLLNSKNVIPKSLKVSMFVYYIDNLANDKNLSSKSISAGDVSVSFGNTQDKKEKKAYLGVSGPLSYIGTWENILSFLESLYSASPYIISVDNISFKRSGELWRVDLNIIGYYVPEKEYKVNYYSPFVEYYKYQDIVDIFTKKAEELK